TTTFTQTTNRPRVRTPLTALIIVRLRFLRLRGDSLHQDIRGRVPSTRTLSILITQTRARGLVIIKVSSSNTTQANTLPSLEKRAATTWKYGPRFISMKTQQEQAC